MTVRDGRFGTDLRLLRDLEHGSSRDPGHDLVTTRRVQTHQVDLATVTALDDLQQALLLRFVTRVGELAKLGHPDYGCRLFELIGELNNDRNRNRAKLFVLQALTDEPRVKEVISVSVTPHPRDRTRIDIAVSLRPIDSDTLLNLVFPFFLQGAPAP